MSGYSALNFGHRHPALIAAAHAQLDRLTLTSRAFVHDQFAEFCHRLAELTGQDLVLPMNTGAEAVETAIKVARKWGYQVKGVPDGQAKIIVAADNFHGRTTTIISFSTDPDARDDFGPYTPGFEIVPVRRPRGAAPRRSTTTPSPCCWSRSRARPACSCRRTATSPGSAPVHRSRTCCSWPTRSRAGSAAPARPSPCDHEGVQPDMHIMGKALGGGIVPVSAVAASRDVLGVLQPGQHGSTFGGNPLSCAVGIEVIKLLETGEYQQRSAELGARLHARPARRWSARASPPYAAAACGPASTSTRP